MTDGVNNNPSATGVNASQNVSTGTVNSTFGCSVQFMYAQLQMELAQSNKERALQKIEAIRLQQAESAAITDAINQLRNLKTAMGDEDEVSISDFGDLSKLDDMTEEQKNAELNTINGYLDEAYTSQNNAKMGEKYAGELFDQILEQNVPYNELDESKLSEGAKQALANSNSSGECESTMMSTEMENYFKSKGLAYDDAGKSRRQNADEWNEAILSLEGRKTYIEVYDMCQKYGIDLPMEGDLTSERIDTIIASLEAAQEEVGSDIQQQMVFIQDYMGQYNSYTQGASSAISDANDTLKAIVTR